MDQSSVSTVDMATVTWHRIIEAFKHAYSLRTQLGDPNVGTESFKDYIKDVCKYVYLIILNPVINARYYSKIYRTNIVVMWTIYIPL